MSSYRVSRVRETIKKEIGEIVQKELKDPRVEHTTVTDVEISPDLKYAVVYLDILGDDTRKTSVLRVLERAKGFIKSELGKRVRLKFLPELNFRRDEAIERGERISEIIEKIHESEK